MLKRTLSTIGLWALITAVLVAFRTPEVGVWLVTVMAVLAQHECYRMLEKMGFHPFRRIGLTLGALTILLPHYARHLLGEVSGIDGALVALILIVASARILWQRDPSSRFETLLSTLFGLVYVPFMLQFFVRIFWMYGPDANDHWTGIFVALWIVAVSKFCDVGAYLVGSAIGKHRMAPTISPGKSWEGAVGGVLVSIGVGCTFIHFLSDQLPPELTLAAGALIALPIAVTSIVSDLIESIMKRGAEMKDSGKTIPGIGGAFDLMDSLVLVAPVGYLLFLLLANR